jgi:hypothetical protein
MRGRRASAAGMGDGAICVSAMSQCYAAYCSSETSISRAISGSGQCRWSRTRRQYDPAELSTGPAGKLFSILTGGISLHEGGYFSWSNE